ncbi:MAG: hypothetical protein HZC28_04455 [Spirochaetes bacterium]|nr:hypothetical protein [Spirochaetota bacterium]
MNEKTCDCCGAPGVRFYDVRRYDSRYTIVCGKCFLAILDDILAANDSGITAGTPPEGVTHGNA